MTGLRDPVSLGVLTGCMDGVHNGYMNKTEAAEILATALVVRARKTGRTQIDKTFYEEFVTECWNGNFAAEGTALWKAAKANPSFKTVRSIGRRNG